ncbi:hypothetical protein Tco_1465445 [Tanacetum coccineum]
MIMERARADRFRRRMRFMESKLRQIRRFRYYDRMRFRRLETFVNMTITCSGMTPEAIEELVNRRVEEALAAYEATRAANALEAENQIQNSNDGYNRNSGNGDGENGNGGNENPNENNRDAMPVARECTYQDFMKCQPLNFKGIEGVVGLIKWFKKMETVFHISNFPEKDQVKYATCTLLNSALTWWNSHKRTIGAKVAFAMSWRELMKLMAEMVPKEEDRVKKFIGGLPDNIQGNVITDEPTRLQDAVRIANNLMDQKLKGYAVKNSEKRRRLECGRQGYYRSDCPKLKDQNCGNKTRNKNGVGEASGKAYVLGEGDANPDSNVVKGFSKIAQAMYEATAENMKFWGRLERKAMKLHFNYQKELNMRRRRWLELLRDYDCEIRYHPGKANVVSDALIRKEWNKPLRVGDAQLTGPKIVHETTEKIIQIKKRIQAARDRQKSYADRRCNPLEFEVGDKVMLKVSPWKGVICFGKRGKLNPRYIRPFKILAKVGMLAYRLELPEQLSRVQALFMFPI